MLRKQEVTGMIACALAIFLVIGCLGFPETPVVPQEKIVTPVASAKAITRTQDVIYGRKDGVALTMDVFKPAEPNGAAIIEIVSGGYFSSHAAISEPIIDTFLKRGYTVFCVVHGSQPRYQVPEIFQDIQRASRFIHHHAKEYGIDPKRIGVTGASAGGNLSLLLATAGTTGDPKAADPVDGETSRVQAVACFFPPTDFLNYGGPGIERIRGTDFDPRFRPSFDHREKDPQTSLFERVTDTNKLKEISRGISPIYAVTKESPPTLIMHGDQDTLVPLQQAQTMVDKLKAAGVPAELIVKKGGSHGWPGIIADVDKFADWFDRHLAKQTTTRFSTQTEKILIFQNAVAPMPELQ
jgi:acetyl esterase/lipase